MSDFKKALDKLYLKHGMTDSKQFLTKEITSTHNITLNFHDGW